MKRLAENLELYERALWLLQGVEVILMDTAGGIGELQQWALERADQAVVLCPPDYVAANNIAKVLSDEDLQLARAHDARAQRLAPGGRRRPGRDRAPLRAPQLRGAHPRARTTTSTCGSRSTRRPTRSRRCRAARGCRSSAWPPRSARALR